MYTTVLTVADPEFWEGQRREGRKACGQDC